MLTDLQIEDVPDGYCDPSELGPLATATLAQNPCLRRPTAPIPPRVKADSPAVAVMTNFKRVPAITVDPGARIDDANRKMIEYAVRLLLVVGRSNAVLGIISASDILGEKPLQIVRERGVRRAEVEVRDLMTPCCELQVIQRLDMLKARVRHVVAALKCVQRQHALVVEPDGQGTCQAVCGMFSASQIARQLGVPVHVGDVARTFSEIERMLNHESAPMHPVR